eukprot:8921741-Ditylum_brightwellii.AAC.1
MGAKSKISTRRRSSIELRNIASLIKVVPLEIGSSEEYDEDGFQKHKTAAAAGNKVFLFNLPQKTCLNPRYSLRKQIMLSFGITITVPILLVMIASIIVTITTMEAVESEGRKAITEATHIISKSIPRYKAELISMKVPLRMASLIGE